MACGAIDSNPPGMDDVDAGDDPDDEIDGGVDSPDAGTEVCNSQLATVGVPGPTIATMNADGSNLISLTNNPSDFPAWSPDGSKIAFQDSGSSELMVMNADGSGLQRLSLGRFPSWSPDGQSIAFQSRANAQDDISLINADGTGEVTLTSLGGTRPSWSPDGSKIVFTANRDGDNDIFAMNPDGTAQRNISANAVDDESPTISRDSAVVAFASNGALGLVNMDGTGSQTRALGGLVSSPRFSPDGTQIAYSAEENGTNNVVVRALDLTNPIIVGQGREPRWSPKSDAVAYISGESEPFQVAVADARAAASGIEITSDFRFRVEWSPCQQ